MQADAITADVVVLDQGRPAGAGAEAGRLHPSGRREAAPSWGSRRGSWRRLPPHRTPAGRRARRHQRGPRYRRTDLRVPHRRPGDRAISHDITSRWRKQEDYRTVAAGEGPAARRGDVDHGERRPQVERSGRPRPRRPHRPGPGEGIETRRGALGSATGPGPYPSCPSKARGAERRVWSAPPRGGRPVAGGPGGNDRGASPQLMAAYSNPLPSGPVGRPLGRECWRPSLQRLRPWAARGSGDDRTAVPRADGRAGRKSILVFSDGFQTTWTSDPLFDRAVDASQSANTAVYFVDVKGLEIHRPGGGDAVRGDRGVLPRKRGDRDGRREHGRPSIRDTNDLVGGVERIADESSTYYLLGYQPDKAPDGNWHKLEVKVDRPGLKVRTRRGYQATPPPAVALPPPVKVKTDKHERRRKRPSGGSTRR